MMSIEMARQSVCVLFFLSFFFGSRAALQYYYKIYDIGLVKSGLPYGVSFFSILMTSGSTVGVCSVAGAIVVGTGIEQSGPEKPKSQKHRFVLVHTCRGGRRGDSK